MSVRGHFRTHAPQQITSSFDQLVQDAVDIGCRLPDRVDQVCPLWVKSGHRGSNLQCPLYPRKRTFAHAIRMSALRQKATLPVLCAQKKDCLTRRPPRNSIPIQRPEVRMPSGPPVTLTWPVTFRFLPSKLTTASALSTMLCASNVLPSWLHATPCGHCPILTSATFVSVVPLTLKTTSRP